MKILLDNGHGNNTAGKRSPVWRDGTQLFEFEFNRDIVSRVHFGLAAKGIDSVFLVPELYDISLVERVKRVNTIAKKEKAILISIHANAGRGTGWEAFTSIGETKSDAIATLLYIEAIKKLKDLFPIRKDIVDGDFDKESDFYILKNTICPAVLTENLFMDTEKDCRFIMSEEGRKTIAEIHINALQKMFP